MIKEKELYEAINSLESCNNPNYDTIKKLADFYIVKNELYGDTREKATPVTVEESVIGDYGDSDFLRVVCGKNAIQVFEVFDELMTTLKIINPRLYNGVMRKL